MYFIFADRMSWWVVGGVACGFIFAVSKRMAYILAGVDRGQVTLFVLLLQDREALSQCFNCI
jgi:hypothetical protein